jgi:hypothetical protein
LSQPDISSSRKIFYKNDIKRSKDKEFDDLKSNYTETSKNISSEVSTSITSRNNTYNHDFNLIKQSNDISNIKSFVDTD